MFRVSLKLNNYRNITNEFLLYYPKFVIKSEHHGFCFNIVYIIIFMKKNNEKRIEHIILLKKED